MASIKRRAMPAVSHEAASFAEASLWNWTSKLLDLGFRRTDNSLANLGDQLLLALIRIDGQEPMVPPLQVRKHCELAVTGEKDRLYGNEGVRDLRDLVGAAARVRQIGNDEPGHVGQGQNCPSEVLARWLVEVEQDRQVLVLAEFVTEGIKNCFALRREAAKDQDSFFTDGVDNVADFLDCEAGGR